MIQPLKSATSVWSLCWLDFSEPLPIEKDFFLPTVLLLVGPQFEPLAPPEILAELDQIEAEDWLSRVFDDIGVPDELLVWKAPEWVPEDWKFFARDWKTKIKIVSPPPHEARLQSQITESGGIKIKRKKNIAAAEIAAGLVRNLRHLHSARKRRTTLEKAAELDESNNEAKVLMGDTEMAAGRYAKALEFFDDVENSSKSDLKRRTVRWWHDPSTRPFLRALSGSMLCQWHLGRASDAAEIAQHLLQIDPSDHMGARFYLPLFLLLAGENDSTVDFFRHYTKTYPKDMPNAWLNFAWGLSLCLEGDDQGARKKYREGILANIYIAPRLIGERTPPEDIYHPTDRDEPQSASEFSGAFGSLWDREASAMRILRDTHEEMKPAVGELVSRRTRLADFMNQHYDPDYRGKWSKMLDDDEQFVKNILEED
jgi:tetratricopeptide (TPR) repeat protein